MDEETYHRARVLAAEKQSSVSAEVRRMLREFAAEQTEFECLKRREQAVLARLRQRSNRFSGARRLKRDELHDRDGLR